jgi:DNA-binding NarL/FixJ family response regulator
MLPPVRIIICENHFLVREGLKRALTANTTFSFQLENEAQDWSDMESLVRTHKPEMLLLSDEVLREKGLPELENLCRRLPKLKVVLMGIRRDPVFWEAAQSGKLCGYFWKGIDQERFEKGMSDVLQGCSFLHFRADESHSRNGTKSPQRQNPQRKSAWQKDLNLLKESIRSSGLSPRRLAIKRSPAACLSATKR